MSNLLPKSTKLTDSEWDLLFQSLRYTRQAFQNYQLYPSRSFRLTQIDAVDILKEKLRALREEQRTRS